MLLVQFVDCLFCVGRLLTPIGTRFLGRHNSLFDLLVLV